MFSRSSTPPSSRRGTRSSRWRDRSGIQSAPSSGGSRHHSHITPLEELTTCLNRLESMVETTRKSYHDPSSSLLSSSSDAQSASTNKPKGFFRSRKETTTAKKEQQQPQKQQQAEPPSPPRLLYGRRPEKQAKFIAMVQVGDEDEMVELLRRIAELVIVGEKAAAAALARSEKRPQGNPNDDDEDDDDGIREADSYLALFERFFERNALALFVKIVTGEAFAANPKGTDESDIWDGDSEEEEEKDSSNPKQHEEDRREDDQTEEECTMLPSLPIATQAVQSVSMLVQNVARATSLYFLLSNNYINELIACPLELYSTAEKNLRGDSFGPTLPRRSTSPELAELTTHFVTFLKSLALRMNAETLQFFLSYPTEHFRIGSGVASSTHFSVKTSSDEEKPLDEVGGNLGTSPTKQPVAVHCVDVDFPLYARALEFCAAHQDSFVRLTAMNICLNTLRLATVSEGSGEDNADVRDRGFSPDGVLHNAKPLPLRERLAIAQHVCSPTRVEGLVSPIFTKLAQHWGILEEQFRNMDGTERQMPDESNLSAVGDGMKRSRISKVERAKQEARRGKLGDSFRRAVGDLQDELLLLDDVFKVGLTSLSEQLIEMMMATFVYPLLLQPLLLYVQRLPASREDQATPQLSQAFSGDLSVDSSFGTFSTAAVRNASHESAPARTALFTLASVFHFVSNRPLLRLLLTALLHPLAPDASAETVVRAFPDVACTRPDGRIGVRVDDPVLSLKQNETLTYSFGNVTGRRSSRRNSSLGDSDHSSSSSEKCVFVLSPALVEILEGKPGDLALITKCRPNPYRQSLLRCLLGGPNMIQMHRLSILLIDALASKFEGKFFGNLVFGSGMKSYGDDIPMDERNLDTHNAHRKLDRDIGGGGHAVSRRTLFSSSHRASSGADYLTEFVTSLCLGIVNVSLQNGVWKLEFNDVAAHALLCTVRMNDRALQTAEKLLGRRKSQCAMFVAENPSRMDLSSSDRARSEENEESNVGAMLDKIMNDSVRKGKLSILEDLLFLPEKSSDASDLREYLIPVAQESDFCDLTERTCSLMVASTDAGTSSTKEAMGTAANASLAFFRLDAFVNLMQDLAATSANALRRERVAGIAISSHGTIVDTSAYTEKNLDRNLYAPLSNEFRAALFDHDEEKGLPAPGTVVGLVGRTALPCVCEVPSGVGSLFDDSTATVVSEGVKWQSLYLVFLGRYMILAQPEKGGSGGDGRVVSSCKLAQILVEKDPTPPVGSGSTARRLLLSYDGYDRKPPSMFLFDERPVDSIFGPFVRLRKIRSSLDVWFEDERASEQAFSVLSSRIEKAKSKRGNRLKEKLTPEDNATSVPS